MKMMLDQVADCIGDPSRYCQEHDERFYYICRACFNLRHKEPVHLKVKVGEVRPVKRRRKPT